MPPEKISIHALRKERDTDDPSLPRAAREFQSTRSARSATDEESAEVVYKTISIHALRKERDPHNRSAADAQRISIHALRKERDNSPMTLPAEAIFQSTRSARSATAAGYGGGSEGCISIHALRKERDHLTASAIAPIYISIHALRKERDDHPHRRAC